MFETDSFLFDIVQMSLLLACLCLTTVTAEHYGSAKGYGSAGYGHGAPSLPPFGAAASHPKYGHGYGGHGSHDYVIARRFEETHRNPHSVDSAYAYHVDGQSVQVARTDVHDKYHH